MPSISQQPVKGQEMPPQALIDGVSQQEINAAVREHVAKHKAKPTVPLADYEALEKRLKHTQSRLLTALDQMNLAKDMFRQSAILFQNIHDGLKQQSRIQAVLQNTIADAMILADLGIRESYCWQTTMESERNWLAEDAA